jgi:tetratricopeptide (TPR) repeat protein
MHLWGFSFIKRQIIRQRASQFRSIKVAAILLACTLLLLFAFDILVIPAPFLMITLAASLVLFVPGFLLAGLIENQPHSLPERLVLAFSLSIGLWSIPTILMLWLHANLIDVIWLVSIVTLLLAIVTLFRVLQSQTAQPHPKPTGSAAPKNQTVSLDWPQLIYWGTFLLILVLFLLITANMAGPSRKWDRVLYQAFIRHFLDAEQFLTKGFRVSSSHIITTARELTQPWVLLLALVINLAQVEMLEAYVYYVPLMLIPLSFFALYALTKELFNNQLMALTACLVQALYCLSDSVTHESLGLSLLQRIIEDKFLIRFILLPVALWLTLRYLKQGGKVSLTSLIITIIAVGLAHPMGVVLYGISSGLFFLITLSFGMWQEKKEKLSRVIPIVGVMLFVALIPLWQRQQMVSSEFGVQYLEVERGVRFNERLLIFSHKVDQYIASPNLIAHPLTILAILLTPLLLRYLRTHLSARFLFANMAGVLILCYTPVITPLLGKVIAPGMIWRVLWLLPVSLVITFFLGEAVQKLINLFEQVSPQWFQLVPLGTILAGALLLQGQIADGLGQLAEIKRRALTPEEKAVFTYLREHGTPGSTIMVSSNQLSNEIPGLVGHSYGITFRSAPPLFASAPEDRTGFYETRFVTNTNLDILQKYDIKYIILETETELASQFKWFSSMFQLLYTNQSYVLYQWQPELATEVDSGIVRGNTYLLQGNLAAAEIAYRQALQQQPEHPLAAMGLGDLYLAEGKAEEALAAYQRAIATIPDEVWLRVHLGEIYDAQGETEKAIAQYQQIIELEPDNAEAYSRLGELYRKRVGSYPSPCCGRSAVATLRPSGPFWNWGTSIERKESWRKPSLNTGR